MAMSDEHLRKIAKKVRDFGLNPRSAGKCALSLPTPCIQPEKDQNSPRAHEADAQSLTRLPHAVQGKREPHHGEPGQGQDVHAEENILGEHCLCPWSVAVASLLGCQLTASARPSHRVHSPGAPGLPDLWGTEKAAERWIAKISPEAYRDLIRV
jgi:hypothetical protein